MPTINLTTDQLLKSLQNSALPAEEKKEFEGLIGGMTEKEKQELMALIEDANGSKEKFEKEKLKKLAELNATTEEKLKTLDREETKHVREEFEKFDQVENEKELIIVKEEINENQQESEQVAEKNRIKPHHGSRNFVLIILGLALVAGAVIYGLLTM